MYALHRDRKFVVRSLLLAAALILAQGPADALTTEPPANDNIAAAAVINEVPFSAAQDLSAATQEAGEPSCSAAVKTSWFRFIPSVATDLRVVSGAGATTRAFVSVFRGTDFASFTPVRTCSTTSSTLSLSSGLTYSIQMAAQAFEPQSVSFELIPLGGIAGNVTDVNGEPVQEICVDAYQIDGDGFFVSYSGDITGADGSYRIISLPPGPHTVAFFACGDTNYRTEFYDNKSDEADADKVIVANGAVVDGIDAELDIGGLIRGQLTVPGGGPAGNACLEAFDASNGEIRGYGWSNSAGHYVISVGGSGTYKLRLGCLFGGYVTEWYDNVGDEASATPIPVASGETVTGIDAELVLRSTPANDAFANAATVGSLPFDTTVDLYRATLETGEPAPCGTNAGRTAWYKITPDADGIVAVNTRGSQANAVLGVYTGTDVATLHTVACNHDNTRGKNQISFRAAQGETYFLQVGGPYNTRLSIDYAYGVVENLPLAAPTPCALLCPYWASPSADTQFEKEETCAENPPSPAGSWADYAIEVPATVDIGGGHERVPTELAFLVAPGIDHDSYICYESSESGSRYVASGANTTSEMCEPGPVKCEEQITIPVQPGEKFILRVFNWADPSENPNAAYGYKVAQS